MSAIPMATISKAEVERLKYELDMALRSEEILLEACEAALEHLDHTDISYANGNTHNGIDEGEHYGGIAHCSLTKELRAAISKARRRVGDKNNIID